GLGKGEAECIVLAQETNADREGDAPTEPKRQRIANGE
ncbi:MAG: hypothetical protein OGMRLDGQ_001901, partial [Candidatus Fervidibacter sp.]